MLNSETLEVGIGMAFLFLTVSLICTAIQEWIEGIMKWRAMDLERALRTLLDDVDGDQMTQKLLHHPMLTSLFIGRYDPSKLWNSRATAGDGAKHMRLHARRHLPSYIPARQFATALMDLVARGEATGQPGEADQQPLTPELLRARVAAFPNAHLRRALLGAIDHGGETLEGVRRNLESWFDGSMDRASGWYKRRAQAVLFVLGLACAAVINVDALHVIDRLVADKAFREAVVKQAETVKAPEAPAPAASGASAPTLSATTQRLADLRDSLRSVGMPIGWKQGVPVQVCEKSCPKVAQLEWLDWGRVLLGWLLTAFAVMLGAPFWFDVLNRFMVLRSTVKPREKSPEESTKGKVPAAPATSK